jgi:hypothetical protein
VGHNLADTRYAIYPLSAIWCARKKARSRRDSGFCFWLVVRCWFSISMMLDAGNKGLLYS